MGGAYVFVVQPCHPPDVNGFPIEMLLLVHTLKLSSAMRITAVFGYFPYSRQDSKVGPSRRNCCEPRRPQPKPRIPIGAAVVAQMVESMGKNPHAPHSTFLFSSSPPPKERTASHGGPSQRPDPGVLPQVPR